MVYMGSKARLSKYLVPIIQSYITESTVGYLEPFVGGANIIDKIKCDKKYGLDIHEPLIELLKWVQNMDNELPETISEEEYIQVRDNRDYYPLWYQGLVGFSCGYSAKYFGGFARSMKSDGVTPRNHPSERIRNIKKQRGDLQNIIFQTRDFLKINNLNGYVIYCDPPYRGTTKYKTENFPYEEFYKWCRELSKNNIVLISEYNMPEDFKVIWKKEHKVLIDSNRESKNKGNKRIEKLFICKQG